MNKTKEERQAWVASLTPGTEVIKVMRGRRQIKSRVARVTPTGIVRLVDGSSFKLSYWENDVVNYGGPYARLIPAN